MKLTTLLLIIALVQASAAGYSQITLKEKNAPLEKVLSDIEKQTKYVFLYDANDLNTGPVTVNVINVTLEQALAQCFKDYPVDFTIEENNVLLKTKQVPAPLPVKQLLPNIEVHGRVVGENGQPLSAATVQIKNGKQQVTVTDEKGFFTLKDVEGNAIVVITMIGYDKRELTAAINMGDIRLAVANSKLDEVKVIAYGTTTERLNTGDVTTVSANDIEKQPVDNPLLALEGEVPGLNVRVGSGVAGSQTDVEIRGRSSIVNGTAPLYIIDGVPYNNTTLPATGGFLQGSFGDPLSFLDMHDIASISVLKDADATAIYGSRGADGVIIITTKKGRPGTRQFELNIQDGIGQVPHEMKLLNTQQYLQLRHQAFSNDGVQPSPNTDYDLTLWDTTRYTNWQKVLIGGTAQYQDIEGALSGGDSTTQYRIGGGLNRNTTVFPGSFSNIKGSANFSLTNTSPNKRLTISLSANYTVDNNTLPGIDLTQEALTLPPDAPPLNLNGSLNWAPNAQGVSSWPNQENPISYTLDESQYKTYNLISAATVNYLIKTGLNVKCDFGYNNMQNNGFSDVPLISIDPSRWSVFQRYSYFSYGNSQTWNIEPQISYATILSKGKLSALIGNTIEENNSAGQIYYASGFNSDQLLQDVSAATSITPSTTTSNIYRYFSAFARVNYNWQNKYLLDINFRRDGSSKFGPDNRFANFYSLGGAWIFSEENSVKNNLPSLSFGKLRASYGTAGSDQVGAYSYLDEYQNISNIGVPYQGASGLFPATIYTPNLQWELTKKFEVGVEMGFFNERILLNASYYLDKSSNQLINYQIASITGFQSELKNLPATVRNEGIEFDLSTRNLASPIFRWSTKFSYSDNSNKLVSGTGLSGFYQQFVGYSLGSYFVYKFLNVNPITGQYEFADRHGNPTTTPNYSTDRTTNINVNPKFFGGIQNTLSYNSFSIDVFFQFVKQVGLQYPLFNLPGGLSNQPITALNYWRAPGDVTDTPRPSNSGASVQEYSNAFSSSSTLAFGDASYIRLKNASVSWQLPDNWARHMGLKRCRLLILGQNLVTFTRYKGLDPETQGLFALPILRVITGGVSATF